MTYLGLPMVRVRGRADRYGGCVNLFFIFMSISKTQSSVSEGQHAVPVVTAVPGMESCTAIWCRG